MAVVGPGQLCESLRRGAARSVSLMRKAYQQAPCQALDKRNPRCKTARLHRGAKEFYYFTETLQGLRYGDWKFRFVAQDKWFNGVQNSLTTPVITNLKLDPFERFQHARGFDEWQENRSYLITPAFNQLGVFMKSLKDYSPRTKSVDFDIDTLMEELTSGAAR